MEMRDFSRRQLPIDCPLVSDSFTYDSLLPGNMFDPLFGVTADMAVFEYGVSASFNLSPFTVEPFTDATPIFEPPKDYEKSLPTLDTEQNSESPSMITCMFGPGIDQEHESQPLLDSLQDSQYIPNETTDSATIIETPIENIIVSTEKNIVVDASQSLDTSLVPNEDFDITKFINGSDEDTSRKKSAPQTATTKSHKRSTINKQKYNRNFKAGVKRLDMKAQRYITEEADSGIHLSLDNSQATLNESDDDNIDVETVQESMGPIVLKAENNIKVEAVEVYESSAVLPTESHVDIKIEPIDEDESVLEAKDIASLLLKFEASQLADVGSLPVLDLNVFPNADNSVRIKSDCSTTSYNSSNVIVKKEECLGTQIQLDNLQSPTPISNLPYEFQGLTDFAGTEEILSYNGSQEIVGPVNTDDIVSLEATKLSGGATNIKQENGYHVLDEFFSDMQSLVDEYPITVKEEVLSNHCDSVVLPEAKYAVKEPLQKEQTLIANNSNIHLGFHHEVVPSDVSGVNFESPLKKSTNSAVIDDSNGYKGCLDESRSNANNYKTLENIERNATIYVNSQSCLEDGEHRSPKRIKLDVDHIDNGEIEVNTILKKDKPLLARDESSMTSSNLKNGYHKLSGSKPRECKVPEDVIARIKKEATRRKTIALIPPIPPTKRKNGSRYQEKTSSVETGPCTSVERHISLQEGVPKKSINNSAVSGDKSIIPKHEVSLSMPGSHASVAKNGTNQVVSGNIFSIPKNGLNQVILGSHLNIPKSGENLVLYAKDPAMPEKNIKIQIVKTNTNSNQIIEATPCPSVFLDHSYAYCPPTPVHHKLEQIAEPCKREQVTVIRNQPTVKNADGKWMVSLLKNNTIHTSEATQKKKLNLEEYKKRRYMSDVKPKSQPSSATSSRCSSPSQDDETIRKIKLQQKMMLMAEEVLKTTPKSVTSNDAGKEAEKSKPLLQVATKVQHKPKGLQSITLLSIGVNTDPIQGHVEGLQEIAPILKARKFNSSSLILSIVENQVKAQAPPQQSAKAGSSGTEHGEDKTIIYRPKNRAPMMTKTASVQTDLSLIAQIKEVQKTVKQLPGSSGLGSSRPSTSRACSTRASSSWASSSRASSSRTSSSSMSSPGPSSSSSSSSSRGASLNKRRRNNSSSSSSSWSERQSEEGSSRSSRYSSPHSSSSISVSDSPSDSRANSPVRMHNQINQEAYNQGYLPVHNQVYPQAYNQVYAPAANQAYHQDYRNRIYPDDPEFIEDAKKRRVVFVGDINGFITEDDLRRKFARFGRIKRLSLHKVCPKSPMIGYGFVTYTTMESAVRAIERGNEDRSEPAYYLHFGGRRAFCKDPYSDLDNMNDEDDYYMPTTQEDDDYFELLARFVCDRRRVI